jgi:hypothetical protein
MRKTLSTFLVLFSLSAFGQSRTLDLSEGFTSKLMRDSLLNVAGVEQSDYKYHFRFWQENQMVEIITKDSLHFEGYLVNIAQRQDPNNVEQKFTKTYIDRVQLHSDQVRDHTPTN